MEVYTLPDIVCSDEQSVRNFCDILGGILFSEKQPSVDLIKDGNGGYRCTFLTGNKDSEGTMQFYCWIKRQGRICFKIQESVIPFDVIQPLWKNILDHTSVLEEKRLDLSITELSGAIPKIKEKLFVH